MPYPNEHAARLKDPKQFDRFRRENNKFGSGVHAIWGIAEGKPVQLQALRFQASKFTAQEARAWLKKHDYHPIAFEPASGKSKERAARSFRGAAGGGELRTAQFEGRDHLVVPVIALVEGVIHASNSDHPELVLAEEFGRVPAAWNGRPVMLDHPEVDGQKVAANSPRVLEAMRLGYVFNARLEDARLKVEAWLDPERATMLGDEAERVLASLRAGEKVEVSVGVFVDAEMVSGERDGEEYEAVWREVIPDHLAFLPPGKVGACSVEMGCGAPRAASTGGEDMATTDEGKGFLARLRDRFITTSPPPILTEVERLLRRCTERRVPWPEAEALASLAAEAGTSDVELRRALEEALNATEPAFLGVVEVYPDAAKVIYAVAPEGEPVFYRRSYELSESGEVASLGDDAEEGRWVQTFEPVTAAAGSTCGCGARSNINAPAGTEESMDKKARVAAIISSGKTCFKPEQATLLEGADDALLKHLEDSIAAAPVPEPAKVEDPPVAAPAPAPATEPEPLTEEKALAALPDLKRIVESARAAEAKRRTDLVASLKDAAKAAYSEDELRAMSVEQLEKVAALVGKPKADFAPLAPREAGQAPERPRSSDELRAAMRESLKVARPS